MAEVGESEIVRFVCPCKALERRVLDVRGAKVTTQERKFGHF
ncbi:hypothetical protein [Parablautia sp. Marseille-Q6255]|nr:hypothetical protein [Parablautia sp. Marseille-Q6255]